jgi:hypothetical protein
MNKQTRDIQVPIMVSKKELEFIDSLVDKIKGSRAQIFRLGIEKLKEGDFFGKK